MSDAATVAIDAPAAPSTAPHRDDEALSRKFRPARCAEIELGRSFGVWVPWVTPTADGPAPPWMQVGFRLFELLAGSPSSVIEVYPYAGYRRLARGRPLPPKSTPQGLKARVDLLRENGLMAPRLEMWSHDSLDAAMAALIALRRSLGRATEASCGHDGSAIWLP